MDTRGDGSPSGDRVAEIRADIVAARSKIAAELEALRFKTDVPARVGDSLANLAIAVTERVMDQVSSAESEPAAADVDPEP
jgi:Protein of unknown function (DUF3618)